MNTSNYEIALDFALQTNRNIFLTGKAGTGKTTFLHNLKKITNKQIAIVAPTGVAAINAGGVTIHSFFQLPFTPFFPTSEGKKDLIEKSKMRSNKRKILQELELLVIDEISMVRADTLDAIDHMLRHVRFRHRDEFGGVQVVFIGDMFQLSPVASDDEWRYLSQYYESPYFFHSHIVQQKPPVYIELEKIYRQSDINFIKILNEVRNNCLSSSSIEILNSRYNPLFVPPSDDSFITLTTHNYKADLINSEELRKLSSQVVSFKAIIDGEFYEKSYPTDEILNLKIGAKVMLIKNDTETPRRFYNGKIGVIQSFAKDTIQVKCPEDDSVIDVSRMEWENVRYTANPTTKKIDEDVIGKFIQFPLRLAWAITIHKSQGLTFNKAVIDAGEAFASGQVYVALSRCTNLEGMVLHSKINPNSIENDRQILEHEKQKLPSEILKTELNKSLNEFRAYIIQQLFNYSSITNKFARFKKSFEEISSSFNSETKGYIDNIHNQLSILEDVGSKFSTQIDRIFIEQDIDESFLTERIYAASTFFTEKIKLITDILKESPASTDNKESASIFNEEMKDLFGVLSLKTYIMKNLQFPFSAENYFSIKNKFTIPEFSINAYSKSGTKTKITSRHPKLYFKLLELRNNISDNESMPIYLIANTKSIQEMSDFLPLSEKDLLQIHGFGKTKVARYGKKFLDVITEYCLDNNLTSFIYEKSIEDKSKRKKK
jgi:hypothetical protein